MKIRIKFAKYGTMKFIGHLDVMRFFQKVFRRANIDIAFSEGMRKALRPLTGFVTGRLIPAVNAFGYRDTLGYWHEPDQFPELDPTYHDMAIMAYYRYLKDYS